MCVCFISVSNSRVSLTQCLDPFHGSRDWCEGTRKTWFVLPGIVTHQWTSVGVNGRKTIYEMLPEDRTRRTRDLSSRCRMSWGECRWSSSFTSGRSKSVLGGPRRDVGRWGGMWGVGFTVVSMEPGVSVKTVLWRSIHLDLLSPILWIYVSERDGL